ncbi:MAG: TIM barrel protein [Caldilineaceae bacterium]
MATLYPGLVSVTFRQLTPAQIIDLAEQAGLVGIEWGGDIHVPHGDLAQARLVGDQTHAAGLQVAAYGSYYRVGHPETGPFTDVLASAVALGAPVIRVWAGQQGSASADDAYWDTVVQDSVHIAELAATAGIPVAYEFHRNTLTDSYAAAHRLLIRAGHPNLFTYWQPPWHATVAQNLAGLAQLAPWLHNIHIFHWRWQDGARLPLQEGEADWLAYLTKLKTFNGNRFALLEFVAGDAPAQFRQDAATFTSWLQH